MATTEVLWIKLKVGMFDGESFKTIKRAKIGGKKGRDKLTAVWVELMDLCAKCNHNGELINGKGLAMTAEDVATMIDRDTKEVGQCLSFFVAENMIEFENGVYRLTKWNMYQSEGGLDKIRRQRREAQARWRAKQQEDSTEEYKQDEVVDSSVESTTDYASNSNSNIYIDLYKDIEKGDIKGECEGEKKRSGKAVPDYSGTTFSADMIEAVEAWLQYKRERRESYKPTGLKSLITQIQRKSDTYGEAAVIALIRECMAANWQGIIFDRLQQNRGGYGQANEPKTKNPFFAAAMKSNTDGGATTESAHAERARLPQTGGKTYDGF